MQKQKPQAIEHYMSTSGGALASILERANVLRDLQLNLQRYLSAHFDPRLYGVMNVRNNTLILWSANASIATQLRFHRELLLNSLHDDDQYKAIQNISILIRPDLYKT